MKKVQLAALAMLTLGCIAAFAQSGAEIDKLLSTDEVSLSLAARYVLPAADILPADATTESSFTAALEKGWLPADAVSDAPIRLAELSFLITKAFDIKGGAMYSIFPGPRYAYRELLYLRVIQGMSDPKQTVSGERLMRILGRVLDRQGGES